MPTKTLANIRDDMSLEMGDYLHSTVTTAIVASTNVVDTTLANEEGGTVDDTWKDWWIKFTSENNNGVVRKISSYTFSSTTIVVLGGNLTVETAGEKATYELHKHNPTKKKDAINIVSRKMYPRLHREMIDLSVIAGDILPDFNWWIDSSTHKFWLASNTTLARTSPSASTGLSRDQRFSMKSTTSAGNGYTYINGKIYPRLLDLQDQTISAYVQVNPSTADDVFLDIYTKTIAGVEATESSATTTFAGKYQPIRIEDYKVPDNLEQFELRVRTVTSGQNTYISQPRIVGKRVSDYMIPELFQNGSINWVRMQYSGGDNFKPADDIGFDALYFDAFGTFPVTQDVNGTSYNFLRVPQYYNNWPSTWRRNYHLEISGTIPLEDDLSADTDTMTIDDPYTQLLVLEAVKQTYKMLRGQGSSSTSDAYETEIVRIDFEISRLSNLRMGMPVSMLRMR